MAAKDQSVRVGCVQIDNRDAVSIADRDANVLRATELIRRTHAKTPCRLYILPELFTVGYAEEVFPNIYKLAESWTGYSFQKFSALAQELNCWICYGFPRAVERGDLIEESGLTKENKFTIAQAVVDPKGNTVAAYDKRHVCQFGDCTENDYFVKGPTPQNNVFEIDGLLFGLTICYDIRFPEGFRTLALEKKVDVILHPSSFPMDIAAPSWHPFVITRALENQVYVISTSKAGKHFGKSIFCPPWIEGGDRTGDTTPVVLDQTEQVCIYTVKKSVINRVRRDYPLRIDRKHGPDSRL